MAEKTIPELEFVTEITDEALFIIDTGTQTFKMTAEDVALYMRDALLPAGLTSPYAGATAPAGWLLCDGSAVSRTTYVRLFTAIGTVYGIGDGSTTFNLPDARGRVIAGKDDMGGSAALRITNAVAGFIGTTLGAAGGAQAYTPAGTNGGTQSIAHTHGMAHAHCWSTWYSVGVPAGHLGYNYSMNAMDVTETSINVGQDTRIYGLESTGNQEYSSGTPKSGASVQNHANQTPFYTTGALGAPSGNGGTATTAGMSTAATVNGSNFTFSGTASHRVQPTIIMNTLIKT